MTGSAGAAKRQEWSRRLERFAGSSLTVVAFCEQEQVSTPAFSQWRRKLGMPARTETVTRGRNDAQVLGPQAFVPVRITQAAYGGCAFRMAWSCGCRRAMWRC
jgi:hypothetical protein